MNYSSKRFLIRIFSVVVVFIFNSSMGLAIAGAVLPAGSV
jgi:hypothetical protein